MARRSNDANRTKPWRAEIKVDGIKYFLGYFETWGEADREERESRMLLTGKETPGHHNCECPSHGRSMVWAGY